MFSDVFNELLAENELNRKQFAERSGIPYTTVVGWTNLNRLPDYTALLKIADFFQCSVDFIMDRQENNDKNYFSAEVTKSEQTLLKNFRKLDNENKELVLNLIKNLSKKV